MKKLKPTAQISGSSTVINKPTNYSNINSLSSSLANSSIIINSNINSNNNNLSHGYDIY